MGIGGEYARVLGRNDIKFITLFRQGRRTATRHGHLQSDENTRVSASLERFFYLNWVKAKENGRLRRGMNVVEGEEMKKRKEWEFCQTLLKEICAIKPQNQLIGRCYP